MMVLEHAVDVRFSTQPRVEFSACSLTVLKRKSRLCRLIFTCVSSHASLHMRLFTCVSSHASLHMRLFTCVSSHASLHMRLRYSASGLMPLLLPCLRRQRFRCLRLSVRWLLRQERGLSTVLSAESARKTFKPTSSPMPGWVQGWLPSWVCSVSGGSQ